MNEQDLIKRFNAGEEKAFKEIFYIFYRKVFFAITKIIGKYHNQDAEDMVLQIMQKLFNRHNNFNLLDGISRFLFICARNAAHNYLNKKEIIYNTEICNEILNDEKWVEYQEEHISLIVLLRKEIGKLKGAQKKVMQMLYYENLTHDQVAESLNITRQTVHAHHSRAKAKLIQVLCATRSAGNYRHVWTDKKIKKR